MLKKIKNGKGKKESLYCLAVDPGFVETGLVLIAPGKKLKAFATFRAPQGIHDSCRAIGLTKAIGEQILDWLEPLALINANVLVGIELPVYTGNAVVFTKQVRLIQEIEAWLSAILSTARLIEIYPTESKFILTGRGGANKEEMINASPFKKMSMPRETQEALADAWGHGIAALSLRDNAVDISEYNYIERPAEKIMEGFA